MLLSSYTKTFLEDFFPSLVALLTSLFPSHLAQPACYLKEIQLDLFVNVQELKNQMGIRNPTLLPIQTFGIITGFFGYATIRDLSNISNRRLLSFAFLYFSLMNLTSIVCHNFVSRNSSAWIWAGIFDVAFTGASALCLAASSFRSLDPDGGNVSKNVRNKDSSSGLILSNLPEAIFIACLSVASLGRVNSWAWAPEAVYLGSMVVATLVLGPRLRTLFPKGALLDYLIIALGVLLLHLSCVSDGLLFCGLMEQDAYFTGVHLIFLGSDITFLGLHRYIVSSSAANDNKILTKSNID